jgi:hypothetical protein
MAVNQKDPGFGRFSPRAFEWRFAKCAKLKSTASGLIFMAV